MINQIVALATLAVLTKAAYTMAEVYSPKVETSPRVKPEEGSKLGEFVARLRGSELARQFPPERIEQIKKKELRRYKLAQDKKWQNWLENVSR